MGVRCNPSTYKILLMLMPSYSSVLDRSVVKSLLCLPCLLVPLGRTADVASQDGPQHCIPATLILSPASQRVHPAEEGHHNRSPTAAQPFALTPSCASFAAIAFRPTTPRRVCVEADRRQQKRGRVCLIHEMEDAEGAARSDAALAWLCIVYSQG
jgi:hypothetical protein